MNSLTATRTSNLRAAPDDLGRQEQADLISAWRDETLAGSNPAWPLPLPSWVVNVDVHIHNPEGDGEIIVTLQGRDWAAGEFHANLEVTYLVHGAIERSKGEGCFSAFEDPVVLIPELLPTQTSAQALQLAEVVGGAGAELRDFEASRRG